MSSTDSWQPFRLGDIVRFEYGASLPTQLRRQGAYPVMGSNGRVGSHLDYLVEGPGIVVGRKGTVGALTWMNEPFWPIDTTYYAQPSGSIDLRWLYWKLQTLGLRNLDSSTGVPGLNRNDAYRIDVEVPPFLEQRRIAEILDTLDDQIHTTEQAISKLENSRRGVVQDLLSSNSDTYCSKWIRDSISHLGEVKLGRQRAPQFTSRTGGTPYLRVANVFDGYIDYTDVLEMHFSPTDKSQYSLKDGDILLNEGQSIDLVGRSSIYRGKDDIYCYQNTLVRFRPDRSRLLPEYAQIVFGEWLQRGDFMRVALQTTSIAHLGADRFARMSMLVPPLNFQKFVACQVGSWEARIQSERAQAAKLRALQQGLMADLLTGRVRVPVEAES